MTVYQPMWKCYKIGTALNVSPGLPHRKCLVQCHGYAVIVLSYYFSNILITYSANTS